MKKIFLVLFFIFGLGLIFSHNSYAIDDLTIEVTSSSQTQPLCTTSTPCSSYNFLVISTSSDVPLNSSLGLRGRSGSNSTLFDYTVGLRSGYIVLELSNLLDYSNFYSLNVVSFSNYTAGTITFTFKESLSSACPEPTPPACDDPEENSRFIQVVIDAFWKYHIAFAGCAAALIAIFVIYRIIKGLLR